MFAIYDDVICDPTEYTNHISVILIRQCKFKQSRYVEGSLCISDILDCENPSNEGFSMEEIQEWDAIGIARRIHIRGAIGYNQQGPRTDLSCTIKSMANL